MTSHFLGLHWVLDATGCRPPQAITAERLRGLLQAIPDTLSLHAVAPPQVHEHGSLLAGVVLLAESHFSLHYEREEARLHCDLFSCAPFDGQVARSELQAAFAFEGAHEQVLERKSQGE